MLFLGVVVSGVAGIVHPAQENPNNHAAAFTEYAQSSQWTAIHLGQFMGMAILIAGLLTLFLALHLQPGMPLWLGRLAAVASVVALALYGVLQAVDGVALKQAVAAWVSAPEAEKTSRFATAEGIRWLEWGMRSYHSFVLGMSFVLFAVVIIWTARIAQAVGYLMGLAGLAYLVQGWVLGTQGFSATNRLPTLLGILAVIASSLWLLIVTWRMKLTGSVSGVR